jgi:hypothetical protein
MQGTPGALAKLGPVIDPHGLMAYTVRLRPSTKSRYSAGTAQKVTGAGSPPSALLPEYEIAVMLLKLLAMAAACDMPREPPFFPRRGPCHPKSHFDATTGFSRPPSMSMNRTFGSRCHPPQPPMPRLRALSALLAPFRRIIPSACEIRAHVLGEARAIILRRAHHLFVHQPLQILLVPALPPVDIRVPRRRR